jgi:hypothetical protein
MSQQIPIMMDIFQHSKQVLVWLGKHEEDLEALACIGGLAGHDVTIPWDHLQLFVGMVENFGLAPLVSQGIEFNDNGALSSFADIGVRLCQFFSQLDGHFVEPCDTRAPDFRLRYVASMGMSSAMDQVRRMNATFARDKVLAAVSLMVGAVK